MRSLRIMTRDLWHLLMTSEDSPALSWEEMANLLAADPSGHFRTELLHTFAFATDCLRFGNPQKRICFNFQSSNTKPYGVAWKFKGYRFFGGSVSLGSFSTSNTCFSIPQFGKVVHFETVFDIPSYRVISKETKNSCRRRSTSVRGCPRFASVGLLQRKLQLYELDNGWPESEKGDIFAASSMTITK